MSDDGYFYDDEGEDFDGDLFWNDDGEIILADDLAEHTLPSPVYAEDPAYETMDGYSDWEYYSDDYYDDDPMLLKCNPQGGSPLQSRSFKRLNGPQRGKKRKLAATNDIPDLSLDHELKGGKIAARPYSKGTVWRSNSPEMKEKDLYQPGMGDRVALLENWREVFKTSQPFGKHRRKSPLCTRQFGGGSTDTSIDALRTDARPPKNESIIGATEGLKLEDSEIVEPRDNKRRRISFADNAQRPPKHKVVVEIPAQGINRIGKDKPPSPKQTAAKALSSRKRKASDIENENPSEGPVKTRAKKVASGKAALKVRDKEKAPPLPSGRTTRSKKK